MAGSSFGCIFRVTTWGESHGPALGAVVDGCPAGLPLSPADFRPLMERRRPNAGPMSTMRKEADEVEILSGVFEGKTTGTPVSLLIRNTDQHSADYGPIAHIFRPGHADFGFAAKYGIRDYRGGGRSSGRETAGRVAAAAIAEKILARVGVTFKTKVVSVGGRPTEEAEEAVAAARAAGDSLGSVVECVIRGVPAGIGEPVFDKLDARLGGALFSIGAVKAVEIGDGVQAASSSGSENNDPFRIRDGRTVTAANHAGGILGGISDGADILIRVSFKPTPSISLMQQTVTDGGDETQVRIRGRHDPVIGPRAAVVVEAMAALTLTDEMMINQSARMDAFEAFYRRSDH